MGIPVMGLINFDPRPITLIYRIPLLDARHCRAVRILITHNAVSQLHAVTACSNMQAVKPDIPDTTIAIVDWE